MFSVMKDLQDQASEYKNIMKCHMMMFYDKCHVTKWQLLKTFSSGFTLKKSWILAIWQIFAKIEIFRIISQIETSKKQARAKPGQAQECSVQSSVLTLLKMEISIQTTHFKVWYTRCLGGWFEKVKSKQDWVSFMSQPY